MHRQSAFTLIEVLLSIALLALVSTVLISGVSQFFKARDERPDDRFWQAVTAARQQALDRESTVTLTFDEKAGDLMWSGNGASGSLHLSGATLRFLPEDKGSSVLLGGSLIEADVVTRVRFYADGTCDAFRVELTAADHRREILRIDPWTCAPVLTPGS